MESGDSATAMLNNSGDKVIPVPVTIVHVDPKYVSIIVTKATDEFPKGHRCLVGWNAFPEGE